MSDKNLINPRTTSYEFLGPPGALAITVGVPVMTYILSFGCSEANGGCPPKVNFDSIVASLSNPSWWRSLWDTEAFLIYLAWYAFCVLSWAILPGPTVEGVTLRTGRKKRYKINGEILPITCHGLLTTLMWAQRYRHSYSRWVARVVISFVLVQKILHSFTTNGLDLLRLR